MGLSILCLCCDVVEGCLVRYLNIDDCLALSRCCKRFRKVVEWCSEIRVLRKGVSDDSVCEESQSLGLVRCRRLEIKRSKLLTGTGLSTLGLDVMRLVELSLTQAVEIDDGDISGMKSLEILRLPRCKGISDEGIKGMVKMRVLDLSLSMNVTDSGIRDMIEMEELWLFFNMKVTMSGIEKMKGLRVLMMAYNRYIFQDEVSRKLGAMEKLYLRR